MNRARKRKLCFMLESYSLEKVVHILDYQEQSERTDVRFTALRHLRAHLTIPLEPHICSRNSVSREINTHL